MKRSLLLILVIWMVNCKPQQVLTPDVSTPAVSSSVTSITAIEWKLMKMRDRDLSTFNPPVTLILDETRKAISGHGGCNKYFGGYQLNGENISFTGIGSTKMYCQDKQAIEDAYFKSLSTIQSYKTEGNKLYLLASGKIVLEFSGQ